MKANYHTHTMRCKHAIGKDEDYIRAAIAAGYDQIGFSDHTPWPYASDFVSGVRMAQGELEEYVQSLRALGEKYKDQIRVLVGLECEYFPAYMDWLFEKKQELGLDYLILGNHFDETDESGVYFGSISTPQMLHRYVNSTVRALETGEFLYLAHPDLYMRSYPEFDRDCRAAAKDLCRAVREMGLLVEYNLEGVRASQNEGRLLYPHPAFWETAADEDVRAIIGVDAHSPQSLEKTVLWQQSYDLLRGMGFEIVTSLSL